MNKILLIFILVAATAGGAAYFYQKSKDKTQQEEEIIPARVVDEKPRPIAQEMEKPVEHEPAATVPVAEEKPKNNPKAQAGHFEVSRPAHDDETGTDNPGFGKAREKKLWAIFQEKGSDLARSVKVKNIHCRVDTCIVEAEARDGNAERFQSLMYALSKQYPWLGNKIDVTTPPDAPHVARFVYFHETPK